MEKAKVSDALATIDKVLAKQKEREEWAKAEVRKLGLNW